MDLDPSQRDMIVRTVIGEAADQPPIGQAAVAHVIMNRVNAGTYGKTPTDVVLKPSAFEPWQTRASELATIPRNSKLYQQVNTIVNGVANGDIPDPTSGATHFANVKTVQDRGNNSALGWINKMQNVTQIGDHTFGNADGPPLAMAQEKAPQDFLGAFIKQANGGDTQPVAVQPSTDAPDYLSGFLKAKDNEVAPQTAQAATAQSGSRPPLPPEGYFNGRLHINVAPDNTNSEPKSAISSAIQEFKDRTINPILNAPQGVATVANDYGNRLSELAGQNAGLVGEGLSDITQNKSATGAAKVGLGALGYLFSPASAIDKPIENITGNKGFGEKAAMLLPGAPLGKIANAARPTIAALKDVIKDVGQENLPAIISRLESNPNLTLMDVAPAVRGNAAGLATDPRNVPAMTHLNQFQKERMATRQASTANAFEDVLGPTPNVKDTLDTIKEQAQKTGKNMIEPAVASAKPVDVTDIIDSLDRKLPSATVRMLKEGKEPPALPDESKRIWALRERLRGDTPEGQPVVATPNDVHELQKELRLSSSDPQIGYQARQTRNALVNALDTASGGKYKPGLKQYADDKAVDEAFRHGFELFSNPTSAEKSLANHPDMWKAWAQDASSAELEAAKKGAMIGAKSRIVNMRKGIDIPEGGFTQDRLAAIVGDKEAKKVVKQLNDWRDIAETDNLLTKNSATAVRQAGQEARSVRNDRSGSDILQSLAPGAIVGAATHFFTGNPIWSAILGGGAIGAGKAANVLGKAKDVAANKAYAQWASATGQKKEDLLNILRQAAAKSSPASNSQKLMNLAPSALLQALPR